MATKRVPERFVGKAERGKAKPQKKAASSKRITPAKRATAPKKTVSPKKDDTPTNGEPRMTPPTLHDLFEQLSDHRITPNPADYIMIQLITQPRSKETKLLLKHNHQLLEVQSLLKEASEGDEPVRSTASSSLLAFREMVATEESGNREQAIEKSRSLLATIDRVKYPLTCAQAFLKMGTAMAVRSDEKTDLREVVESLHQALAFFGETEEPVLRCLAHYNLAFAFGNLWRQGGDWDEDESRAKQQALRHGTEAIRLMNEGNVAGNRLSLTKYLLTLLLSDGDSVLYEEQTRIFVTKLLKDFLASKDAKSLGRDERDNLRNLLATVRSQG